MPTLYRKYRPQTFSDITGQEHVVQTITNQISTEKTAHAYLFSGPRGVGKTTLARLLAKAVNCAERKKGTPEPCDKCSSCTEIAAGRNIDVIEIDAASNTGVDNVRENIIDNAQFKPTKSPFKVFIIDEVHMLSNSAFNALLKTLEEPPSHVIFILATTELQKLPATIISRCQRFNFKKIPLELMIKRLNSLAKEENRKVDADVIERVALKSDGCLRDAESLLGQLMSLEAEIITAENANAILPAAQMDEANDFINSLLNSQVNQTFENIDKLAREGRNLEAACEDILQIIRLGLIYQTGFEIKEMHLLTENQIETVKNLARKISAEKLITAADKTAQRTREIKSAIIPQLPLELLAIELNEIFKSPVKKDDLPRPPEKSITPPPAKKPDIPEIKTVEEKPKENISPMTEAVVNLSNISATMEETQKTWSALIEKVGQSNPSLTFILKMADITEITNGVITFSLPYSFHKDKIEEPKTKRFLEDIITEITGNKISLSCFLKNAQEVAAKQESPAISDLALEFGGEVVG